MRRPNAPVWSPKCENVHTNFNVRYRSNDTKVISDLFFLLKQIWIFANW